MRNLIEETIQRVSVSVKLTEMQKEDFRKLINKQYGKMISFDKNKMEILFSDYYENFTNSPFEKTIEFYKRISFIPPIINIPKLTKEAHGKIFKRL